MGTYGYLMGLKAESPNKGPASGEDHREGMSEQMNDPCTCLFLEVIKQGMLTRLSMLCLIPGLMIHRSFPTGVFPNDLPVPCVPPSYLPATY